MLVLLLLGFTLVNGVQCTFSLGESVLHTPVCSSSNDDPKPYELMLAHDEYVTAMSIRYGALIDSLSLTTSLGQKLVVGGAGGEHTSTVS